MLSIAIWPILAALAAAVVEVTETIIMTAGPVIVSVMTKMSGGQTWM